MNKNLKQYFEEEKNKTIYESGALDLENRNSFKRILNNLNIKENNFTESVKSKNILSLYTKYFIALLAPLALAVFSFFFFDLTKFENMGNVDINEVEIIAMQEQVQNIAMMSSESNVNMQMSRTGKQSIHSTDLETYKQELLGVLDETDAFEGISLNDI
jgi:hypothetical protein